MSSRDHMLPLIGVCDGQLDPNKYRTSYLTNKVGGQPDWLPPLVPPRAPRCRRCGAASAHVVQVYCPLEASPYHRNLHLFACPRSDCSGRSECWTALRSQCLEADAVPARTAGRPGRHNRPQEAAPTATDWCDSADDWGMMEEEDGGVEQKVQVHKEAAALDTQESPPAREMDVSHQLQDLSLTELEELPAFRPFFISVGEESDLCGEDKDLQRAQELLRDYERREGALLGELEESGGGGGGGGQEKYEKTGARHGDAVFARFMKTISLCPEQILRYCRDGDPLFVAKPPSSMAQVVPPCSRCGGPRTFELQLMPALVSLLRGTEGSAEAELEFGTALVYTCTGSCWTSGSRTPVEEFCFVQTDPDQQLFK